MNILKFVSGKRSAEIRKEKGGIDGVMWETVEIPKEEVEEEFECCGYDFFIRKNMSTYQVYEKTTSTVMGVAFYRKVQCFEITKIHIIDQVKQGLLEKTIRYRIGQRGFINGGPEDLPFDINLIENTKNTKIKEETTYNSNTEVTKVKITNEAPVKVVTSGGGLF